MKLVVTGVAGFIGMHTASRLLQSGHEVLGLDTLNDYYDPQLKHDRLAQLQGQTGFRFEKLVFGVFNFGQHSRDLTYIDDIVSGVVAVTTGKLPVKSDSGKTGQDPAASDAPYRIYNIANNQPVQLMDFLAELENCLGKPAELEMLPAQPGDAQYAWADCSDSQRDFYYHPETNLTEGMQRFITWFREYYSVKGREKQCV